MYFPYDEVTPGEKAGDFDTLLAQMKKAVLQGDTYGREERHRCRDLFYCQEGQGPVGERILDMIQEGKLR